MGNIEAVIFDKDATLFEFGDTWATFCDQMIKKLAQGDPTLESKLALVCGYNLATRSFLPGSIVIGGSISELCSGWAAVSQRFSGSEVMDLSKQVISELRPEPLCDLKALSEALTNLGLRLGLVTNDLESAARSQLSSQGVDDTFEVIWGSDSGFASKPAPDALLGFCNKVGKPPSKVAMVGDSLHDLRAAKACNMGMAIGVLTGPAQREELAPFADVILKSVEDLPALLADTQMNKSK